MNNGLDLMRARLRQHGGVTQQERMIKDKRETLDRVVHYSYQGARVRKVGSETVDPALINPNQVKQNYDDKIISIGYEYNYGPGTIFDWVNTNTKWLIYLQDLTELAYFKGDIRKCSYEISWRDSKGEVKSTFAAIRGPVETQLNTTIKENISFDFPNHSLNILIPKNEDTLAYFTRYTEFYLKLLNGKNSSICWRIEAVDDISMPGIIEVNAVEYYSNKDEDNIEEGLVGDLIVEEIPEPSDVEIEGEIFIKPKKSYTYTCASGGEWSYDTRLPIQSTVEGNTITLKWTTTYTGQFVLSCGDKEKTIVVESLF